jgi:Spy/CpxP family protein refolding chaperone
MVKHVSIEIDASQEQETKLIELATRAAREVMPLRDDMRETREKLHDLLMAETIDREALDALRSERLAQFEQVSKSLVDTLADVAEVLNREQREILDERIREFRSRHEGRRRG